MENTELPESSTTENAGPIIPVITPIPENSTIPSKINDIFTVSTSPTPDAPLPLQSHTVKFLSDTDLDDKPSKFEDILNYNLTPDSNIDFSALPSVMEDGRPNFKCPCLGSMPNGPCGQKFRKSFSCWARYKDDQMSQEFVTYCQPLFIDWSECMGQYPKYYSDPGKANRPHWKFKNEDPQNQYFFGKK